jgi:hypothetical protein
MQKPNRASYTAAELLDWASTNALVITPKFQRRGVWQPAARSFFIDTLLREMPVPPVYFRMTQSPKKDRVVREVIDGQQRISAVTAYMRDEFALSGALISQWKGKRFSQLVGEEQDRIRTYAFSVETFSGITDAEVLEVFSRLNTYSIRLNAQELRNGKYFGFFKQAVYQLAYEHLEFWRSHGIFGERSIARMEEAELVSELLIAAISGLQDKKKSIDSFYARYNERFEEHERLVTRFRAVIAEITAAVHVPLKETEFHRVPLFYSLFAAVYHRMYGLTGEALPRRQSQISENERGRLGQAVIFLSDTLRAFSDGEQALDPEVTPFVEASLRQTDNLKPRQTRLRFIYERAFG